MAKNKNTPELIYVKLEYPEVLQSKKDIISLQLNLVKFEKILKTYSQLRKLELQQKENLLESTKATKNSLKKLQSLLPKLKVPRILKKHEKEETSVVKKELATHSENRLETQLQDIQNKLKELQE